ncbi:MULTISPECIES: PAAR domain-containing protein [Pseudomonas]|uniref:PAAR domain-containing protein n=1 Tax=Pseudomonas azadiae TaxID=2843612 RepID=A0ABS6P1G9_9PSED|nr:MULTISPECIES: PAAR domain-containing protein [Pseudomonas]MBV4454312.1 PAAR domain-containing protein [Pseudomonas azadiae]NMF42050.1 PAAR domain-containing protein [Pseudomonas sp. SWRI 103]
MIEGYFIGKGDKTSCGGEVLDGDPRVDIHGLLHAREGDRVTCGKHEGTYQILGGISHFESHGKLVAGTLDSFSSCPCRAKLIPSVYTATYSNEGYPSQSNRRNPEPTPSSASHHSALPQQSNFAASNNVPPLAFKGQPGQEPGFYIVPQSMSREALEKILFPTPDPAVMRKFQALNPGTASVKAGSMIVLSDPDNTSCTYQESQLMQAAQQVDAALDSLTPDEADFLHRHGAEIAGFIGHTSTWLGVSAMVMETHLTNLRNTLQAIERLHQEQYRLHGHLKSPQFFAERQRLLAKLDAHLLNSTRLRGQTTLGDHPKLKTALGISSRSLVHHWDKAGAPGQIPGYSAHVEAISRATQYMKAGGYLAIGIGGVSSVLAIEQVCSSGSEAACEKIKFTEAGKFVGSTFVGAFSGLAAGSASGSICLGIGVATGGIGGVICVAAIVGAGAWIGTTIGGKSGEYIGEKIYEATEP